MRSLVVTSSLESIVEWREEVKGLNLVRSTVYAAEGSDGMSPHSQLGFWITCLQKQAKILYAITNPNQRPTTNHTNVKILPPNEGDEVRIDAGVLEFRRKLPGVEDRTMSHQASSVARSERLGFTHALPCRQQRDRPLEVLQIIPKITF